MLKKSTLLFLMWGLMVADRGAVRAEEFSEAPDVSEMELDPADPSAASVSVDGNEIDVPAGHVCIAGFAELLDIPDKTEDAVRVMQIQEEEADAAHAPSLMESAFLPPVSMQSKDRLRGFARGKSLLEHPLPVHSFDVQLSELYLNAGENLEGASAFDLQGLLGEGMSFDLLDRLLGRAPKKSLDFHPLRAPRADLGILESHEPS